MPENYAIAFALTLLAGLSTVIGGVLTFFVKKDDMRTLSIGLGFSAGVMIYLSLTDIASEASHLLEPYFPNSYGWMVLLGFIAGILLTILIDHFLPDHIDGELLENMSCDIRRNRIKRAGVLTAIAMCVHNFPEGLATFFVSSQDLSLGIPLAIAIGLHNIPEGIAVALPIYHATCKKKIAIGYAFMSGITEPIGALVGLLLINTFLPQVAIGFLCASVAGIMIYISFDALLPLSREYGDDHLSIIGILVGIIFIWSSTLLFQ